MPLSAGLAQALPQPVRARLQQRRELGGSRSLAPQRGGEEKKDAEKTRERTHGEGGASWLVAGAGEVYAVGIAKLVTENGNVKFRSKHSSRLQISEHDAVDSNARHE